MAIQITVLKYKLITNLVLKLHGLKKQIEAENEVAFFRLN